MNKLAPDSIINGLDELNALCAEVKYNDWQIETANVSQHPETDCYDLKARWVFFERDNLKPEDPTLHKQECRWWFIPYGSTRSDVLKTLFLAAQQAALHEMQEQFRVGGKTMLNPHARVRV